ncbi:hypothetical protein EYV94_00010 [Puteibacter caeruleilacunae]|nr:hypothetical protein EYV94_00010 [Puteibacter caeruleilacunae]
MSKTRWMLCVLVLFSFNTLKAQIVMQNCDGTGMQTISTENDIKIEAGQCKIITSSAGKMKTNIEVYGTLTINDDITLNGNIKVDGGTLTINNDITVVDTDGNLEVHNNSQVFINNATITTGGKMEIKDGGEITMSGATFESTGNDVVIDVQGLLDMNNQSDLIVKSGKKVEIKSGGEITSDGTGNEIFGEVKEEGSLGVKFYKPTSNNKYWIDDITWTVDGPDEACEGETISITATLIGSPKGGTHYLMVFQGSTELTITPKNSSKIKIGASSTFSVTLIDGSPITVAIGHDNSGKRDSERLLLTVVYQNVTTNVIQPINGESE